MMYLIAFERIGVRVTTSSNKHYFVIYCFIIADQLTSMMQ